jgi:predicted Zn-ribbon and HTH transcriptional regulator
MFFLLLKKNIHPLSILDNLFKTDFSFFVMAWYRCENCGWEGRKPLFMEPATRMCPRCRSINIKRVKKE